MAEDRIRRLPTEEHMILVEGSLQNPADSAPAEADGELNTLTPKGITGFGRILRIFNFDQAGLLHRP